MVPWPGRHTGDSVGAGHLGIGGSGLEVLGGSQAYCLALLALFGGQSAVGGVPPTSGILQRGGLPRAVTPRIQPQWKPEADTVRPRYWRHCRRRCMGRLLRILWYRPRTVREKRSEVDHDRGVGRRRAGEGQRPRIRGALHVVGTGEAPRRVRVIREWAICGGEPVGRQPVPRPFTVRRPRVRLLRGRSLSGFNRPVRASPPSRRGPWGPPGRRRGRCTSRSRCP